MSRKREKKMKISAIILIICLALVGCKHNILTMKYKEDVKEEENLGDEVEKSKKDAVQGTEIVEVCIITPSYTNPFFKSEAEQLTKKLKEYGYSVRALSHTEDADEQENLFQTAIDDGAAAIICDNANSKLSAEMIEEAKQQGIATVLIDRGIEEEDVALAQILSNNYDGATRVAQEFANKMQEEGKYIELLGLESDENAEIRSKAFHDVLDGMKNLQLVAKERGDWDRQKAQEIVTQVLFEEENKDIKGILCGNDTMALGALDAVQSAGLDHEVIITGIDGSDDVIDEIKKGNIQATVLQPIDSITDEAVEIVNDYLTKNEEPGEKLQQQPCILVTADNAGQVENFTYEEETSEAQ